MDMSVRCVCRSLQKCLIRRRATQLCQKWSAVTISNRDKIPMLVASRNLTTENEIQGFNNFSQRSHSCGEFRHTHIGQEVKICGWVQYKRLMFLVVRDWSGLVQVLLPESMLAVLKELPFESVVEVTGTVQARRDGEVNEEMDTGQIEIHAVNIRVLNLCQEKLPININVKGEETNEMRRMQYRYLDLRNEQLQLNLRLRSAMVMRMREFLHGQGFVDVDTPTLFRRTPGGAREFLVPTSNPGKFYTLPQSPQQFKQLLMVGGMDRYYQIAKCYRDEGSKPDRQPEFTQVDLELSFTTQEDVRNLIEQLIQYFWPAIKGQITIPFPSMTYHEAMIQYGSDKPDTRYDMRLQTVDDLMLDCGIQKIEENMKRAGAHCVALVVPQGSMFSRKEIEGLHKDEKFIFVKVGPAGEFKANTNNLKTGSVTALSTELQVKEGDLIIVVCGEGYTPYEVCGKIRNSAAAKLEDKGVAFIPRNKFNFLWIVDFPLFLPAETGDGLEPAHHPFTAPHPEDEKFLKTDPLKVRSQHYDLVLNGAEVGGGSIRIHDSDMQRYILETILKEDVRQLQHLIDALSFGCPPHGGIALGLERMVAVICGTKSIRDVIAFPKTVEGRDPVSGAPTEISGVDLAHYHIKVDPSLGEKSNEEQ
uniref:Aspartate--tRNA ligase, mitochondrial-like n=1 Tax=Crassostrea virginica TaxID=6565 RepID=A0A8B8ENB4_CRAVI|nr:aspartate--tRNA ligase, mitochondrial-like [Crassostrea virginica]XP_022341403.1 aspartate--tRNA ligase, mitochondrial-like [Crassostrea virginica]